MIDRPIGSEHQRDFDQSEGSACSSEASCQLSAEKCGIIYKTGVLVHCNTIQEEEEEEEKEEEDGDDVEGSPWLNLVIGGASGVGWGEGILVNWDCFFNTIHVDSQVQMVFSK